MIKRKIIISALTVSVLFMIILILLVVLAQMQRGAVFGTHDCVRAYMDAAAAAGFESAADIGKIIKKQQEMKKITISFAGDCTLGGYKGQGGGNLFRDYYDQYGHEYFFQNVREIFGQDDITYVNLEGALTSYGQVADKTFPIKGEPEYVDILTDGSVEAVSLANNHIYDCGQDGYDSCKQLLADHGISYSGESETCTLERDGVRIGLVALSCWGMSDTLSGKLQTQIADLRDNGCEIVCVMFHGGTERAYESSTTTEEFAHQAVDYGADIVVGSHPHVVQGIEVYQGKIICYSLGNFCFGANKNPGDKDSFIFQQTFLVDGAGTVSYGESTVIPCKISSTDTKNDYCPTPQEGAEYDRIMQKLAQCSQKYPVSYFEQAEPAASE